MKFISMLVLAALALPASVSAATLERDADHPQRIPMEVEVCKTQTYLPWCAGTRPQSDRIPDKIQLTSVSGEVRKSMTAVDTVAWGSFYKQFHSGMRWQGDCDNYVYTTIDALIHKGYNVDNILRAAVSVDGDEYIDHIAALVKIDGEWFVFADSSTSVGVYPLGKAKWRLLYTADIDTVQWLPSTIIKDPVLASK